LDKNSQEYKEYTARIENGKRKRCQNQIKAQEATSQIGKNDKKERLRIQTLLD